MKTLTDDGTEKGGAYMFTKIDAAFMWKQAADYNTFTIDQSLIPDRKVIDPNEYKSLAGSAFWDKIKLEFNTDKFCSFTMPFFSQDLSTALIGSWFYEDYRRSHGRSYALYVYKKKNGKWEYMKQLAYID